jgi:glutamate synthase (NADPH/NADH) small chain
MSANAYSAGILPARLDPAQLSQNFSDIAPVLSAHEARVAADRCYFCHDAPCITACPTDIDIPLFIRQIATGTPDAAAKTIFAQNIMGGMCARVCPTEVLCEGACVREMAEGKPVEIGALQRFATDTLMAKGVHPFTRAAPTGKKVAVVGAGPAGLSCAHRLAMLGHEVTVYEAREKSGGLNEYGIAAYKAADDFAAREVDWLLGIGGITLRHGMALGNQISLDQLAADYDAVFLGIGLGGVNALEIPGAVLQGVQSATDFIAHLRQSDKAAVAIGRDVVVIGGGMTAIDAAVQSRLLGAQNVTMVYRGPAAKMGASQYEQDHATSLGVRILHNAAPRAILGQTHVTGVEFDHAGGSISLPADQVFLAIGQTLDHGHLDANALALQGRKLAPNAGRIWAGGDCAAGGADLTVTAVAEGRDAAMNIHRTLVDA